MPSIGFDCLMCGTPITGADDDARGDAFVAHVRAAHPELPYPDVSIRNVAAAIVRQTGPVDRLDTLGAVEIHPVTEERIDDWLAFFDHDAFSDSPIFGASCYCTEPHVLDPKNFDPRHEPSTWQENRALVAGLLRDGGSFGYLAYVDGRAAGWVNASMRKDYALFRRGPGAEPPDEQVVGISCFVIAPPYRRHGLAGRLLDRAVADAADRGATSIESYPFNDERTEDSRNFRGPRSFYEAHGFTVVKVRERDTVMRRTA